MSCSECARVVVIIHAHTRIPTDTHVYTDTFLMPITITTIPLEQQAHMQRTQESRGPHMGSEENCIVNRDWLISTIGHALSL